MTNQISSISFKEAEKNLLPWNEMREKLRIRVISTDQAMKNDKYKHSLWRVHKCGLAEVITVDLGSDVEGSVTHLLGTDILPSFYSVNQNVLFDAARKNGMKYDPPVLENLGSLMLSMATGTISGNLLDQQHNEDDFFSEDNGEECNGYVLTNSSGIYGASVLAYDCGLEGSILSLVADTIGENYYIIPSSIHELILLPESLDYNAADLQKMIREANKTLVRPDDILTNYLYHYDIDEKDFGIVLTG